MKNDLSTVKVGDWLWTIQDGWVKVEDIEHSFSYAIRAGEFSYTIDGKHNDEDKYPSAFTEPPSFFQAEPKPCEFKKGQRVWVWQDEGLSKQRRYFSHMEEGKYLCFYEGKTEWTSGGRTTAWDNCKAWDEGEE